MELERLKWRGPGFRHLVPIAQSGSSVGGWGCFAPVFGGIVKRSDLFVRIGNRGNWGRMGWRFGQSFLWWGLWRSRRPWVLVGWPWSSERWRNSSAEGFGGSVAVEVEEGVGETGPKDEVDFLGRALGN